MSEHKRSKSASAEKDLDCTNATRGVWVVKVPKYISSRWEKAPHLTEAGRLKISKPGETGKPDIKFTLSDDMMKIKDDSNVEIPREHRFIISNIPNQTFLVFSQTGVENGESSSGQVDSASGKLMLEGLVCQKGECRPLADQRYMQLKRQAILKASQPEKQVKQLKRVVQNYKPVSDHRHNIEFEQKKKAEGKKAREDKDKVMDMLFAAFEKHQYYNIKDLEKITRQPIPYLKEILKEICNYNVKNPHKSMWELKQEYRHYRDQDETS